MHSHEKGEDVLCVAVVEDEDREMESVDKDEKCSNKDSEGESRVLKIDLLQLNATEGVDEVVINPDLPESKRDELRALVKEFSDVFTDLPGTTDLVEHDIKLTSDIPVRSKPYPGDNIVDDVLDYSNTWEDHIKSLKLLFQRMRTSHLTARPSKCKLGFTSMDFLGHVVGDSAKS